DFTEDGKLIIRNGFYTIDGELRYYVDAVQQKGLGLIKVGNDYYYINTGGTVVTGTYWVSFPNGNAHTASQNFDEQGRLIHTLGATVVENNIAPDCVNNGSYDNVAYCKICSEERTRETVVVPALGHTSGAVVVENNVAPDCVNNGSYDNVTYCTVCSAEATRTTVVVPALGHTAGAVVVENNVAPDCVNAGSYDNVTYCTVCGAEASRETVVVAALGHTAGAVVVENNVAPDCVNAGSYDNVVYCTVCDAELSRETVVVDALGHSYDAVVTAPTCTEEGYTTYTCSVCGDTYVADKVAALGHGVTTEVIENKIDSTCLEGGSYDRVVYCTVCDAELSRENVINNALGHDLSDWTEKTAATCTAPGEEIKACSRCDYSLSRVVDALGHTAGTAVEENKVESTCTENGSCDMVVYCTVCNAQLSRESVVLEKLAHEFSDWTVTVEPTYTADGEESRSCTNCGETETRVVDMLVCTEHQWSDWTVTVEPQVGVAGEETRTCTVCGATETQEVPALDRPDPAVADVTNYTVTINDIDDIKEIRYALGHYTTGSEVKNAEKNNTLNAAIVEAYTVDGVFTYDLPWIGEYTFWVRTNSGKDYFLYTVVDEINTYVTSDSVKIKVNDFEEGLKDMWVAEGHWTSYYEIKNYCFGFKYQAASPKLTELGKTSHDWSYTLTNPGEYTILFRFNDGTTKVIYHTIEVDVPVFTVDGYKVTVSNIADVKIIRTASGHHTTVGEIKSAAGTRYVKSDIIGGAEEYSIYYPATPGEITVLVEYMSGYKHFEHITLGE
ncbi:MAG: hypothetical protein IKU19_05375, partial [Clostridia bacterium]|nr:hypothetical protein [Clostridia bacterium]